MFVTTENTGIRAAGPPDPSPFVLERQIAELAADINAATCRWLALVAEFERIRGHEAFGAVSCASWLAWRCSITPRAAREQVRVARSLVDLPLIREAFATGSLSYSKVRALTRVAEPAMEPELLELAGEATAAQLERLLRGYRGAIAEESHARARDRRHLSTRWDDDGSLVIRGSLPAEEGAAFLKALELAREEVGNELIADALADGGSEDEAIEGAGVPKVTNADALLALAETAIERGVHAASGGDRHQLVVHVDLETIASGEQSKAAGGEVDESVPIPAETARRLGCDCSVVGLIERNGEPLSVGRKTRSIPPSIARALRARDRCCQFPGCDRDRFVDAHHIEHWAQGGETSLDNLVRLCRHHHGLVHEGGFTVARSGGALVFRRPSGRVVPATAPACKGRSSRVGNSGGDPRPRSRGEHMDADLGVFALASLHERRTGGVAAVP